MKRKQREPWPPIELLLPNLDELERLSRGEEPEPKPRQLDLFGWCCAEPCEVCEVHDSCKLSGVAR